MLQKTFIEFFVIYIFKLILKLVWQLCSTKHSASARSFSTMLANSFLEYLH